MLKKFLIFLSVIAIIFSTFNCLFLVNATNSEKITSTLPDGAVVALLSKDAYNFVKDWTVTKAYGLNEDWDDIYYPSGVKINWTNKTSGATGYILKLATNSKLNNAVEYNVNNTSIVINDLFAGHDYYYTIEAKYQDKTEVSKVHHFKTAKYPRTIYIDGVSNTRDIGGYYTEDGKYRIRQGMIYRGATLEDITAAGIEKAVNTYGIKTELDVRGNEEGFSPLGDNIKYLNYKCPSYLEITSYSYRTALSNAIRAFADESNYPIYLHCSLGRDRTGTIAFLINALCGVSENDLCLDYELSALSYRGQFDNTPYKTLIDSYFKPMYSYLSVNKGNTYAEKIENFMLELGVTKQEIESIRSILLEKVDTPENKEPAKIVEKGNEKLIILVVIVTVVVILGAVIFLVFYNKKK